ncbi:T9SS C-terminal target domain-containing protein [Seonamhaeicola marinus]|uniref:T9SS C-terminal target domain-containing protein n=1 Tax=Seonamhaeicola marinus TaxID=1912246 RepID=A0A5D0IP39_9FLAO|nr:T9SS C-terminal target domain-containing protein [Seonamhaeicola marinus]TYA84137.1 T9SS C-terminal target domain-containing protein [Seonamhaeicola marinus]
MDPIEDDDPNQEQTDPDNSEEEEEEETDDEQSNNHEAVRMYMFGHSLVDIEIENSPRKDEGKIGYWIYLLSQQNNQSFTYTGQWGFLGGHAGSLPPISAWGSEIIPSVWDSDLAPFSDANFNSILITPGNFMQWRPANTPDPNDNNHSLLTKTEILMDWTNTQEEDGMKFYIYENWPDMAPFLTNEQFPATAQQFSNYNNHTMGEFHDWWLEYYDFIRSSRPDAHVKLIPVGSIISKIFENHLDTTIPSSELYVDDAPHGTATIYFLAGLTSYMGIYNTKAPSNFNVPDTIHSEVRDNYNDIVDFIWNELNQFYNSQD